MYYQYCEIGHKDGNICVAHTPVNNEGFVSVNFEQPDAVYGFKTLDCVIPSYRVFNVVGFSQEEVSSLINFCVNNSAIILSAATKGGIANADYL